jgi:hypothetical protein
MIFHHLDQRRQLNAFRIQERYGIGTRNENSGRMPKNTRACSPSNENNVSKIIAGNAGIGIIQSNLKTVTGAGHWRGK